MLQGIIPGLALLGELILILPGPDGLWAGSPTRPVSRPSVDPFTDWSSQSDNNNEVISIPSSDEDDDYVPRSPLYEPNSPVPVSRPDIVDQNPRQNDRESSPTRRPGQINNNDNEERPRSPLGRGTS